MSFCYTFWYLNQVVITFYHTFSSIRVFFHRHWQCTGQQGKWEDYLYSSLPPPPDHEHSDIYLQFCIWDDYFLLLIALHVISRRLFHMNYPHLGIWMWLNIKWLLDDLMLDQKKRWMWTRINCRITSEPINRVNLKYLKYVKNLK